MVGFKIKAKIDSVKLKKIIQQKQRLLQNNIAAVVRKEAIPDIIERIMKGYDELSERADIGPDDPSSPENWRVEFKTRLQQDLEQTFFIEDNRIKVSLGDKEFLGYDSSGTIDPDDTEPLHWLVFFIEGLIGDWAFITPQMYEVLTKGREYKPTWGRFGSGFMVSKENYELQGWQRIIPYSEARHPFSGFKPLDIFTEALKEFQFRPFIKKAIKAASEGRKL